MGVDLTGENENGRPIEEILDPQMCSIVLAALLFLVGALLRRHFGAWSSGR
jgi:hypothetical protein